MSKSLELKNWKFKATDGAQWLEANVPGCVHTDLLHNGEIPDPFYGTNEKELQWIDKKDWEYQTSFDVSDQLLAEDHIDLVFDGLDTYADVMLNGQTILQADNMFRVWKVDVKSLLKKENNVLNIVFQSPIEKGLEKLEELGYNLPAPNDVSEIGGLGENKVSVFTRKAPYHFGWDWGPRFVTSGIWKKVQLKGWSISKITDFWIRQSHITADMAELTAVIEITSDSDYQGEVELSTEGLRTTETVSIKKGTQTIEFDLAINNPKLWWSRGLGEANLYTFALTLVKEGETAANASVRTGLRTIKLVQDKDDAGHSFYFELNGVPVFAKGANHIPNDSFLTDITYDRYRYEIQSAVESNMNMLRIWGGGIYEFDMFYDLCDEYGILVWQDFMFACSMYPGDEAFLNNVKAEAIDNIKRIRNHPSIALWCGNNEIDTAWSEFDEHGGWGWKKQYDQAQREKIWADYEAVFHKILPETVADYAPEAIYWPSSPMAEWTNNEKQHATPPNSGSGDVHYWGVWHGRDPFEDYNVKIGRFMSEYGFQSFPEEKTVRTYAEEKDLELESEVMLLHQKNGAGNQIIKDYMDKYYPDPKDFLAFLHMSQIQQAEAIKSAIEAHRRNKPYTMGTLYWQMNDCWPVASWSSMDYYGRWKALQYVAKRNFKDVMVSVDGRDGEIKIYVVSDILEEVNGKLTIQVLDFTGKPLNEWTADVQVQANQSKVVWSRAEIEVLGSASAEKVLLHVVLTDNHGEVIDDKVHDFVPAKHAHLPIPSIKVTEASGQDGATYILETDQYAKHVWLTAQEEGIFSDNDFDLIPGEAKTVSFLKRIASERGFEKARPGEISVHSLTDYIKEN